MAKTRQGAAVAGKAAHGPVDLEVSGPAILATFALTPSVAQLVDCVKESALR